MADKQDIQRWLEINTFYCPHLSCTMSPRQCEANRKRPKLGEPVQSLVRQPVMPRACETCTDWPKFFEEVERKKATYIKQMKKEEKMSKATKATETKPTKETKSKKKTKAICKGCGKERWIKARGLCSACYRARYGRVTITLQVPTSLFEILQQEAEYNFRSPADQVLAILVDHFVSLEYPRKQILGIDNDKTS